MDHEEQIRTILTVFFEAPFWVGVFERMLYAQVEALVKHFFKIYKKA